MSAERNRMMALANQRAASNRPPPRGGASGRPGVTPPRPSPQGRPLNVNNLPDHLQIRPDTGRVPGMTTQQMGQMQADIAAGQQSVSGIFGPGGGAVGGGMPMPMLRGPGGGGGGPSGPSPQLRAAYEYAMNQLGGLTPTDFSGQVNQNTQALMEMLQGIQSDFQSQAGLGEQRLQEGATARREAIQRFMDMVSQQAGVGRERLGGALSQGQEQLAAALERGRAGQADVESRIAEIMAGAQGRVGGLASEASAQAGDVAGQVGRGAAGFGFDAQQVQSPEMLTGGAQDIMRAAQAQQMAAQAARGNIMGGIDRDVTAGLQQQYGQYLQQLQDMESQGLFSGQQQMSGVEAQLAEQLYGHQMGLANQLSQFGLSGLGITQQGQQSALAASQQYEQMLQQLAAQRAQLGIEAGSAGVGLPQGWA